jgi:vacuolar iron transporter family protein
MKRARDLDETNQTRWQGNMMAAQNSTIADIARYQQNYLVEMDGIELYRALAAAEKDEKRALIFRKMAQTEERHARRWMRLIETAGSTVPEYHPTIRVRVL